MVNGASFSGWWRFSEVNIQMEAYRMKVEFNRLFDKLKTEGMTQKQFRDSVGIGGTTFKKLRGIESITTETICRICDYFHCMPDEIMEFIPDADYMEKQKSKRRSRTTNRRITSETKKPINQQAPENANAKTQNEGAIFIRFTHKIVESEFS